MGKILFPKYFPTCPKDGSDYVIPGYTAVLTSTLAKTMKMFWRPRKIKVSGSYNKFLDTGYIRDCVTPADFELIIKSPYDSEEEMVCDPVKYWKLESSTNVEDPENVFNWGGMPYYYGEKESLYTLNGFEFYMTRGDNPGGGGCFYMVNIKQLYTVEGNGGPYDWNIINIAGVDFNMATYLNDDFQAGYVTASVEVLEWWSFGGTYNTATGEPL
jgi:hypothetical protein